MRSKTLLIALIVIAGPISGAAFAQDSGWYTQITGGPSRIIDNTRQIRSLGFNPVTVDTSSVGYSARVGYLLPRGFGLEAGYTDVGNLNMRGFSLAGPVWSANVHITNWSLAAVARATAGDRLATTVRAGVLEFSQKWKNRGAIAGVLPGKNRGYRATAGITAEWNISGGLSATVAADYYPGPQKAVGLTGGVRFAF